MAVSALLLSLALWPLQSAWAVVCSQPAIQAIAPSRTTIVAATPQADPVPYCHVLGYVTTMNPGPNHVNFQLGLPTKWNHRLLFIGNGGFAGSFDFPSVSLDSIDPFPFFTQVSAGFAAVMTDTGHQGAGIPLLDGSWALNDSAKQDDWLFRGVHVVALASKSITRVFYGHAPRAYFAGCSDGGREALIEAQRFPTDFDGIVAGDPAIGSWIPGFNWNEQHLLATRGRYIPPPKIEMLNAAVIASCDAKDAVLDGLIQDPRRCGFKPASLLCRFGDSLDCLTASQVATVQAIYSAASTLTGKQVYSGFSISDPGDADGWTAWITDSEPPNALGSSEPWIDARFPPLQFAFQDQFLKFFVFGDPSYNSLAFNFNSNDLGRAQAVINRGGADGENPDLSSFRRRRGKLIIYHGWSDPAVSPLETVKYYGSIVQALDGSLDRTRQFARLFMVPGMHHCIGTGGPGPNVFDQLSPIIRWVEDGVPPDQIIAIRYQDNDPRTGMVTRTMPLCPYPEMAAFKGGDVNDASNWACRRRLDNN